MPIPWMLALKAIPWGALLAQAPALAKAADAALFGTRDRPADRAAADEMSIVRARIEALEKQTRAQAELLDQVTHQLAALTTATEVLAARLRWLLVLGLVSAALATLALLTALMTGR